MKVAYARVSSTDQNLDRQIEAFIKELKRKQLLLSFFY